MPNFIYSSFMRKGISSEGWLAKALKSVLVFLALGILWKILEIFFPQVIGRMNEIATDPMSTIRLAIFAIGLGVATGTINFAFRRILREISDQNTDNQTPKAFTVIEAMSKRKNLRSIVTSSACVLAGAAIAYFHLIPRSIGVALIFIAIGTLITIDNLLFSYRVHRGFYGTNAMEVREILRYISKEASKDDLDGMSGGLRPKVMTEDDLNEITEQVQKLAPQPNS